MNTSSVRFRLLLWNIGVLAIALIGFQLLAHFVIRTSLQANLDKRLNDMAEGPISFFSESNMPPPPPPPHTHAGTHPFRDEAKRRRMIRAFDLQGKTFEHPGIVDTVMDTPWDRIALAKAMTGQVVYSITHDRDGLLVRVLSRPLIRNGRRIGVIQAATSYEEMRTLLNTLATIMFILVPCVLVVAGVGGVLLTDRALRPVRHIIRTAEQLNSDDLSQRLPALGTDEFAHLAFTMNGMLSRIERAFTELRQALERERRFTADASHELRTPLTAITANASLALTSDSSLEEYRESMLAINLAALMMRRLVEDLLFLVRSDSGQLTPVFEEIDVRDLFAAVTAMVRKDDSQATIQTDITDDITTLWGDASQLQRVLINLLENALRYTPANGMVTLSVARMDGQVILSVKDTGEGIAAEHLAHLGERFYRVEVSRTRQYGGTGLGLAICRGIVEAHHGQLAIESTPQQGTRVNVFLPEHTAIE